MILLWIVSILINPPDNNTHNNIKNIDSLTIATDSLAAEINCTLKNHYFKNMVDSFAILYYKTGEDRYRRISNRYGDSCSKYYTLEKSINF